jgi:large conductance mechanosensitive channel
MVARPAPSLPVLPAVRCASPWRRRVAAARSHSAAHMLDGFKQFISRGNVVDLAVGVIIGAAFGEIVGSLTKDLINPTLAMVGGQPDLSGIQLGPIQIGNFMNAIISFLIKAGGLYFLIVVPFNRFAARMTAPPNPSEALLGEIRDLLKGRA